MSYVHQTGEVTFPLERLKEHLKGEMVVHGKVIALPTQEWLAKAASVGLKPTAVAAIESAQQKMSKQQLHLPRLVKGPSLTA